MEITGGDKVKPIIDSIENLTVMLRTTKGVMIKPPTVRFSDSQYVILGVVAMMIGVVIIGLFLDD